MSVRRSVSPELPAFSGADLSELKRSDLFVSVPPNHAGDNVDLMIAQTQIHDLRIPAVFLASKGVSVYVAELPEMRAKFARSLLYRAVYRGEIHTADEWCLVLATDGVGYQDKGSEAIRPISEETFRADFNLLAATTKLALVSRASDGERNGFGLARTWHQIKDSENDLYHRADRMYERYLAGEAVEATEDGWLDGNRQIPSSPRWEPELIEMVITELELRNHTNGEIALMLAARRSLRELRRQAKEQGGEIELLSEDQRRRYESLCGSPVRAFISWLALEGVPVCAGALGYWIAKTRKEFRDYLGRPHRFKHSGRVITIHTGYLGRVEATREHAGLLPDVAALWHPLTEDDRRRRQQILDAAPSAFPLSPIASERLRLRRQAEQGRRQDRAADESRDFVSAAKAYLEDRADEYLAAKQAIEAFAASQGGSDRPTKDQHAVKRRYENARQVCRMKFPKRQKVKAGQVPMLWEYVPGEDNAVKVRGVKTASAAELGKKLTPSAKAETVEACPW